MTTNCTIDLHKSAIVGRSVSSTRILRIPPPYNVMTSPLSFQSSKLEDASLDGSRVHFDHRKRRSLPTSPHSHASRTSFTHPPAPNHSSSLHPSLSTRKLAAWIRVLGRKKVRMVVARFAPTSIMLCFFVRDLTFLLRQSSPHCLH